MKEKLSTSVNFLLTMGEKASLVELFRKDGLTLSQGMRKKTKEMLDAYQGTEGVVINAGNSTSE